jgi:glycosyltransferase involved in cell wall biosynthesis
MSVSVSLWHTFTPAGVGLPDEDVARIHSKPFVAALQKLAETEGWDCRVEYITDRLLPRAERHGLVTWRFWPLSNRWSKRSRFFRNQWSVPAWLDVALRPPSVLMLNTSGHGSAFTHALARAATRRGRAYVAILGGVHYDKRPAHVQYLRDAACVVTHTRLQADQMQREPEFAACKFAVLPLGVDCERFQPLAERTPDGEPSLLFVGRLVELKQVHVAIHAMLAVRRRFPRVRLHIVGPESDKAYANRLRDQIRTEELADTVVMHGSMPHDALTAWFQSADLLLLPSLHESFGMVVVESMACGTPVVALEGSGAPTEIIAGGEDGLLLTAETYGEGIADLLSQTGKYAAMRERARHKAETKYHADVTTDKMRAIITDAVAGDREMASRPDRRG